MSNPSTSLCIAPIGLVALLLSGVASALTVNLNVSAPSPQPVANVVRLQATSDGTDVVYRFERGTPDSSWKVLQDFRERPYFDWAAIDENIYFLRVIARDRSNGETALAVKPFFRVSPGVVAGTAVVRNTAHPQVALFSAPACPPGAVVRVRFWRSDVGPPGTTTHDKPCRAGRGVNHYIAGMTPGVQYRMRGEVIGGGNVYPGQVLAWQPANADFDADFSIIDPADAQTSYPDGVLLSAYITGRPDGYFSLASDLAGNPVWSFGKQGTVAGEIDHGMIVRPKAGGTFMVLVGEVDGLRNQFLAEIDLAGNIVRVTNAEAVSERLVALGEDPIGSFHHEARPLANGHTLVLGSVERILTDVQGPGDVNVYGEMVVDLDENFNVVWVWNSFDKLDNSDVAILGETCVPDQGGCPPLFLGEEANDWLHMNAIAYSPADGHLVLSARHQDAVYKIDYANGTGTGDVIWELGEHGDFTLADDLGEDWPWFTHAHDSQYQGPLFAIFDNGNTRRDALGETENSRGQVYLLDEVNMVASLVINADLGGYSLGLGSAHQLANGNFHFNNGFLGTFAQPTFAAQEITPNSDATWVLGGFNRVYRSFRLRSLYQP